MEYRVARTVKDGFNMVEVAIFRGAGGKGEVDIIEKGMVFGIEPSGFLWVGFLGLEKG